MAWETVHELTGRVSHTLPQPPSDSITKSGENSLANALESLQLTGERSLGRKALSPQPTLSHSYW